MNILELKKLDVGRGKERYSFSRQKNAHELDNLLDIQKNSFDWFLEEGIRQVLDDLFPVENFSGTLSLEVGEYRLEEPKRSVKECRERGMTYESSLMADVRLFNNETGEVQEKEVFLGDIPLLTESGSFLINGAERVVVSQLVRSPSVYYTREVDKKGRVSVKSQMIPSRGTWLEFETDAKDVIYVRIDRTRKITVTTLLRAFGLSKDSEIKKMFGNNHYIKNTLARDTSETTDEALLEIYEKLRPGEPATLESAKNHIITRFFDEFRYDLAKVGRYKYNKKLNLYDRLLGCTLVEDLKEGDEVLIPKDTTIDKKLLKEVIKPFLQKGGLVVKSKKINKDLDDIDTYQELKVKIPGSDEEITLIGNDPSVDALRLTIPDVYSAISYYINLLYKHGKFDEIDNLANRRVRPVGELIQNQFRIGLSRTERSIRDRMTTQNIDEVSPTTLINVRPITATIKAFFGSSQLSQFMEQTNPIAELTHKRRLSSLGPGGLSRDRAGMDVRDVNESHYGRICPIESPEGPNIGLITSLAGYAKLNEYGFIMTPYYKVEDGRVTDTIEYLTADEETDLVIVSASEKVGKDNKLLDNFHEARLNGDTILAKTAEVDYMDISAQQIISATTSCIPFLEHNDAARTLMGANMQRQAVPLVTTDSPIVGTGAEGAIAKFTGSELLSKHDGIVSYVDAKKIVIEDAEGKHTYPLDNYELANAGNYKHQRPIVKVGEKVSKGEFLADGPSCDFGELALGHNLKIAFVTFDGFNFEDAVIISERLVKDDVYTSIHLADYEIQCRDTKLGPEEITRDIPNVGEAALKNLDENGIVVVGTEVKEGDILVGKVTPKGMIEMSSEEKLLHAIFGEKSREVRDTSLKVPNGGAGIVHDIKVFTRKDNDALPAGVSKVIRVYIAQKRKIQIGDKVAGRYGNKGVISLVLPVEDMPFLPNGEPVDMILNPQGVPSRMNIGQILELHLGMAANKLGIKVATPAFDGATNEDVFEMMEKAGMDPDGKTVLYDGRTGEPFDNRVAVGIMYMLKLNHMVDDKIHARATGPYSLVTQQPLGGKAQFGGQRFGEMEVWALEAYGAANILQEILTVKSDDVIGRVKTYEALVKGEPIEKAGIPESFRVLMKELQSLGLKISVIDSHDKEWTLKDIEDQNFTTDAQYRVNENAEINVVSKKLEDDDDLLEDELAMLSNIDLDDEEGKGE